MSLQWTFVATFLYVEIFIVILLLLPIISASRWQKIFRSRLLSSFRTYANLYFNIFIVILVILFLDSIRDVKRYSEVNEEGVGDLRNNPSAEAVMHMKLFRAQRNFYIAGFACFLFLVIRRLVVLLAHTAHMEADVIATKRQAESASAAAKQMMEDSDNKANEAGDKGANEIKKELKEVMSQLEKTKTELSAATKNMEAMKKQAQSTNTEYDRLLSEHTQLQGYVKELEGSTDTKKDS